MHIWGYLVISCISFCFLSLLDLCAPSVSLSIRLCICLVDPNPTAAVVDPAGPGPDPGCSCTLSQPAEQHQWGQHLCFCSHTHYPAAPVTAHPDCSCECVLQLNLTTFMKTLKFCLIFKPNWIEVYLHKEAVCNRAICLLYGEKWQRRDPDITDILLSCV